MEQKNIGLPLCKQRCWEKKLGTSQALLHLKWAHLPGHLGWTMAHHFFNFSSQDLGACNGYHFRAINHGLQTMFHPHMTKNNCPPLKNQRLESLPKPLRKKQRSDNGRQMLNSPFHSRWFNRPSQQNSYNNMYVQYVYMCVCVSFYISLQPSWNRWNTKMNYPVAGNCTSKLDPDLGITIPPKGLQRET